MRLLLVPALMLIAALFVPGHTAAEPADVATAVGRWESVPLPDEVADPPLELSPGPVIFRRLLYHPRHPEIVFALSQWALWQSADGGHTWQNLGIMVCEDSEVYLDPNDPLTLYVEPRVSYSAVRRTFDGGRTWEHLERPIPGFRLFRADPERSGRLYGGNWTGLMASDDFGDSWYIMREGRTGMREGRTGFATVTRGSPSTLYTTELAPEDYDGGMGALHRSTDDGVTWEPCDLPAGAEWLCVDPSFAPGLYATDAEGVLYYSPDRGSHWEARPRVPYWSGESGLAVSPAQQHLLYSWNTWTGALARSTDGGYTWQRLVLPDSVSGGAFIPHPRNPLGGYYLYEYWDRAAGRAKAGVLHTEDLQTWRAVPAPEMDLPAGAFALDDQGRLYIGSTFRDEQGRPQASVLRADGSGGWTRLPGCSPALYTPTIVPLVETLLVAGGDAAGLVALYSWPFDPFHSFYVATSLDGGVSWADGGPESSERQTYSVALEDPRGTGTLYLGTAQEGVLRSLDGGQTWTSLTDGFDVGWFTWLNAFALDGVDSDVLYAAFRHGLHWELHWDPSPYTYDLWVSRDAGASWEDADPVPGGGAVQYLAHHPLRPRHLYALTPDALYRTVDGARTWDPVSSIAGAGEQRARRRLRFHPYDPERMLVVTGPRLLATADGGLTWDSLFEGVAAAPWFEDAAWDPQNPDVLYTATPWGVYRANLSGPTTAVASDQTRPERPALSPNYPNPFNPTTTIAYELAEPGLVSLAIYNTLGQRVRTLVCEHQSPGAYTVQWDGRNDAGAPLATGVHLYRLVLDGHHQQTRRMLLLR